MRTSGFSESPQVQTHRHQGKSLAVLVQTGKLLKQYLWLGLLEYREDLAVTDAALDAPLPPRTGLRSWCEP